MNQIALAAIAALSVTGGAQGTLISLSTASLPSTQPGWSYVPFGLHGGLAESSIFSTDGTVLTSNTMGAAIANSPGSARAVYAIAPDAIASDAIVELNARIRVVQSQVLQFNFGFNMGVYGSGKGMSFGFSTATISDHAQIGHAFNTTDWHDYRVVGDWAAGTYEMYIDNQFFRSGSLGPSATNEVLIGDGTGTANANVEIARFSVTLPSPGAGAVLACGGLIGMTRRRRTV